MPLIPSGWEEEERVIYRLPEERNQKSPRAAVKDADYRMGMEMEKSICIQ